MLLIDNDENIPLHVTLLERVCDAHTDKEVELVIIDQESMHALNREHRGVDKTTDVLSFPLEPFAHAPLGSIVINHELAKQKAQELGHTIEEEIALLFIHGLLHLLGYDHEIDQGQMREKEKALIEAYGLPQSLIVRSE